MSVSVRIAGQEDVGAVYQRAVHAARRGDFQALEGELSSLRRFKLANSGTVGTTPTGPPPFTSPNSHNGACAKATGRLSGMGLGRLRLGMKRSLARRIYTRWSTRGRKYMSSTA